MHEGPHLPELYRIFRDAGPDPVHLLVAAEDVPEPYHRLLVHPDHMTVTVEEYYGGPVSVKVLNRRHEGETYSRKILLDHAGQYVQFGIVRIHLNFCSPEVRAAILAEATPLGRILIEHDVLRRIEPTAYFRVEPGPALSRWFGLEQPASTYGRLGFIHCDDRPAIELLEILAPISR